VAGSPPTMTMPAMRRSTRGVGTAVEAARRRGGT
jgi:hypothetical protein